MESGASILKKFNDAQNPKPDYGALRKGVQRMQKGMESAGKLNGKLQGAIAKYKAATGKSNSSGQNPPNDYVRGLRGYNPPYKPASSDRGAPNKISPSATRAASSSGMSINKDGLADVPDKSGASGYDEDEKQAGLGNLQSNGRPLK